MLVVPIVLPCCHTSKPCRSTHLWNLAASHGISPVKRSRRTLAMFAKSTQKYFHFLLRLISRDDISRVFLSFYKRTLVVMHPSALVTSNVSGGRVFLCHVSAPRA